MKTKPTWKPPGLKAKKWRAASQTRGPANLLPAPLKEPERKRTGKQPPYAQQAT